MNARTGLAMVGVLLVCVGCSGEPTVQEGQRNVKEARAGVIADVKRVAAVLDAAGEEVAGARGSVRFCGGGGLSPRAFNYKADARLGPGEDRLGRVNRIADALVADGWKIEYVDETVTAPVAQLERDDVRATIKPAADRAGRLLSDGTLTISFNGPCVDVSSEQVDETQKSDQSIG